MARQTGGMRLGSAQRESRCSLTFLEKGGNQRILVGKVFKEAFSEAFFGSGRCTTPDMQYSWPS